jgi:hypothetical protein
VIQKTNFQEFYGYAQVSDCLNEAYGYEYLKEQGYLEIKFMPIPKKSNGDKTPDLCAILDGRKVALLEVKTIHPSLEEMEYDARISGKIKLGKLSSKDIRCIDFNSNQTLPEGLKRKFEDTIEKARSQLESKTQNDDARKIIFLLIEIDRALISGTPTDKRIADEVRLYLFELGNELNLDERPETPGLSRPGMNGRPERNQL